MDACTALRTASSLLTNRSQFCCCPTVRWVPSSPSAPTASCKESGSLLAQSVMLGATATAVTVPPSPGPPTWYIINMVGNSRSALSFRESLVRSGRGGGTNLSLQAGVGTRRFNLQKRADRNCPYSGTVEKKVF